MVDIWGNIPYTEACNPEEYTMPKYDMAEDIYDYLLDRIHAAAQQLESIQGSYSNSDLNGSDIIAQGDIALWTRIAYSIELRLLMRISYVEDVSSRITDIYRKCLSIEENVEANPGYIAQDDKMNIFFQTYGWDKNINPTVNLRQYCPTSILVDMLRDNNDPRLRVYVDPRRELGDDEDEFAIYSNFGLENEYYVGIPYGQASPAGIERTATTGTGLLAGGSDRSSGMLRSSTFMAGSEVGFLLAEAALRNLIPGGDQVARDYYERSVTSAMKRHEAAMQEPSENFTNYLRSDVLRGMKDPIPGTAEEAAREYLDQNSAFSNWSLMTDDEAKLEAICTQKWLAFMGYNPMEAWFEHRRTDYPELPASNQGQEPRLNFSLLPYPQTERNLNMENLSAVPAFESVYTSLVFWDLVNPTVPATTLYQ